MHRSVLVTGMSGAGRSTCLKFLEDCGFDAVDNLPLSLLPRLLRGADHHPGELAIGIDSRTRGFEPHRLAQFVAEQQAIGVGQVVLLFLDCDDDVLQRRFSETRRRHPLADTRAMGDILAHERALLAPLRQAADLVIDTTELTLPALRRLLDGHFPSGKPRLAITVTSFSFKRGLPREADLVLDVRFLRNPHYEDRLRPLTGHDAEVRAYIADDPDLAPFLGHLEALLAPLLPRYLAEGKSYLTIAIGCTGGRHRSVHVALELSEWLQGLGWEVATLHRDLPTGEPVLEPAP